MGRPVRIIATALFLFGFTPASIPRAGADTPPEPQAPALIQADEIVYDEELGVVTASGNVEISQSGRTLRADAVSFNTRTNVVTASGNVALIEPTGEVVYADFVELTDDLREGFIRDIRVMLTDRSRLAAASGLRSGDRRTVFRRAVFSPCDLCKEDPTRAPLWQLKAYRVTHDQEDKVIQYQDAFMEIFGVPVLYTPYLEHPDPTVERKTGFLAPTFGASSFLGTTIQVPFYWTIAPDQDVTFSPIFTTKQGVVGVGQYRKRFMDGEIEIDGSATIADRDEGDGVREDRFRGHIDAIGRFDINETWRWGFDADRTTDDTYLRAYNFNSEGFLTSRAFIEGFRVRNYASANALAYQNLQQSDPQDEQPIVAPLLDYSFVSQPGRWGSLLNFDPNLMVLSRLEGRESRRLSLKGGWTLPYIGPIGDVYELRAAVQTDAYWVNQVDPDSSAVDPSGNTFSGLTGRFFPQLALTWRYPWVRTGEILDQVIEPIAQVVVGPNGKNTGKIPNEDSQDFEFDDTNLFSLNRFPGRDRVSSGQRVDYGLEWSIFGRQSQSATAFVGQSYNFHTGDAVIEGSGGEDDFSDIVGRVGIDTGPYIDLLYRFRFDKDDLQARRNELGFRVGPSVFNIDVNYLFLEQDPAEDFQDREEIFTRLSAQLGNHWSAFVAQRRDLEENEALETSIGLTYQDECFVIQAVGERTSFRDREVEPEDSIFVRVQFKHLGGIATD